MRPENRSGYETRSTRRSDCLRSSPASGVALRSLAPEAVATANAEAREHLRRAVEDGDWASYESDLQARAVSYARRGLTLRGWHETAFLIVGHVTPLVMRAYRDDPPRAEAAVVALQRFNDRRAVVLGEQFLRTKEEMAREAEAALRRSEADLRSAQKLAAVGKLAGGVAHDFNNLLAVVAGHVDLLERRVTPDGQALDDIEQVRRACARATGLARQLLVFSRQQTIDPPLLDISDVVEETERMLRPVLGPGVKLLLRPALAVGDDGTGMDAATCARIFEPFFTTKEPGKGTGLGLATVRGIVEQAGGFVEVRSELGRGTTFEVYLPCARPSERR